MKLSVAFSMVIVLCGCSAMQKKSKTEVVTLSNEVNAACSYVGKFEVAAELQKSTQKTTIDIAKEDVAKSGGNWMVKVSDKEASIPTFFSYCCADEYVALVKKCDAGDGQACSEYAGIALENN